MPINKQSEPNDLRQWTLDDWNSALYRYYFAAPPNVPLAPLVRLYVTAEDLRTVCVSARLAGEARSAFIDAVKRGYRRALTSG